jgi:hypothetical protein
MICPVSVANEMSGLKGRVEVMSHPNWRLEMDADVLIGQNPVRNNEFVKGTIEFDHSFCVLLRAEHGRRVPSGTIKTFLEARVQGGKAVKQKATLTNQRNSICSSRGPSNKDSVITELRRQGLSYRRGLSKRKGPLLTTTGAISCGADVFRFTVFRKA